MRALQQSTLLTLASRATTSHPSPASRAALLAPLYGVYNLQLEMDEAVLLFPCGMLAFYYLSKVCLGKCFASLWSGTASRLSGSFGSSKRLVAPDVNGLSGFDGLSAEEESIRQVARRPPRPLPPSRIYAPTRVAHPGDAPPRPAAPPPRRPAAPPRRAKEARGPHAPGNTRTCHAGATTQERLRAHVRVGADDAARHGRRALAPQASRLGGFPGAKPAEDAHPGRREPNGLRTSIAPRSI
jgi:hypothetical protein